VINAKMAGAIDVVFSKRGYDPRDFTLCAAGGAAPVHAARLVEELGIKHFMVPKVAPVFCAFGMMYADLKHNFTRSLGCETEKVNIDRINDLFSEMEKEALETFRKEEMGKKDVLIERSMDIRYYGQVREQNASVPDGPFSFETLRVTIDRFHEKHLKILGYSDAKYPTEIVRLHLTGIAKVTPPQPLKLSQGGQNPSKALKGKRKAFFNEFDDLIEVKVYDGNKFLAGNVVEGPSIIEEMMTTLVIPPEVKINVDLYGNYTTITKG
jgi:N-methylhydantoinase A